MNTPQNSPFLEPPPRTTEHLRVFMSRAHAFRGLLFLILKGLRNVGRSPDPHESLKEFEFLNSVLEHEGDAVAYATRLALTHAVDSFEYYLASLLAHVFAKTPSMLKGNSHITYQELIELGSIDAFYAWAAERKVKDLVYQGLPAVMHYLAKMGVRLDAADAWIENAREAFELRHIIVHNDCRVSNTFKEKTTKYRDSVVGERFAVTLDIFDESVIAMSSLAIVIDAQAVEHFKLETVDLPASPATPRVE